jgi:hypothetical protein
MISRCYNASNKSFVHYGGRGIKVCRRWRASFSDFLDDMGMRPTSRHQLERLNNNGNYTPKNCRWATKEEQANNTRKNTVVMMHGKVQTVAQWCREFGIASTTFFNRRRIGWPLEKCFGVSPYQKPITAHGKTLSLLEWARELGVSYGTLHARIHVYGWPISKALTAKKRVNQHK